MVLLILERKNGYLRGYNMINYLEKKLYRDKQFLLSTNQKIILYFTIILVIFYLIFQKVFYSMYTDSVKNVIIKETTAQLEQSCSYVDLIANNIKNTSDILLTNAQIQKELNSYTSKDNLDYFSFLKIISYMQEVGYSIEGLESIDLFIDKNEVLLTTDLGGIYNLSPKNISFYKNIIENDSSLRWLGNYKKNLPIFKTRFGNYITLIRPYYSFPTKKIVGVLAINVRLNIYNNIIKNNKGVYNFIIDNDNGVRIEHSLSDVNRDKFVNYYNNEANKIFFQDGKDKYFYVYINSNYTGWKFGTITSVNDSMDIVFKIGDYLILFLIGNLILIFVIFMILYKNIFTRINKLIPFIKDVEKGKLNIRINDDKKDEFAYIYKSFNGMLDKISTLFSELYEQKLLQKDAKLKLLQSKINPHFIYNIFDNMNWLLQLERYQELETLIYSVSNYYKRTLNFGKDFISVADTLEQLMSYADLQKIRFKDRFTCEFHFQQNILNEIIPNFSLQPLLENSICHGIEPKTGTSRIIVTGYQYEDYMIFSVEDNGVGISDDIYENLKLALNNDQTDSNHFFALVNINRRIKLYYGDAYGISIWTKKNVGTKVSLNIPIKKIRLREEI